MHFSVNKLIIIALSSIMGLCVSFGSAAESFEQAKRGKFTSLQTAYGTLVCKEHVAQVVAGGKTGKASLQMSGGKGKELTLNLKEPPAKDVLFSAWGERLSSQAPFELVILAVGPEGEREIYNGRNLAAEDFKTLIQARIPAGSQSLIFKLNSADNKGLKMDDWVMAPCIPMLLNPRIEMKTDAYPVMVRVQSNPVLSLNMKTEGALKPVTVQAVNLDLAGTSRISDIKSITVMRGGDNPPFLQADDTQILGTVELTGTSNPQVSVKGRLELVPGNNHLWVCVTMQDKASLEGRVAVRPVSVLAGTETIKVADSVPSIQRIGVAVVKPGDFNSKFYRIPGLARTRKGTLLAVYDIRYDHSRDLPANIDVGVSRSEDGGNTWSDVNMAIDDSSINPGLGATKGVGDPAILVDDKTGRIWVAAIWSHKYSIFGSRTGDNSPDVCGQLVLAYSDDDGLTWSKPINITEQTKRKEWQILFNGPGSGICLKDGTLVFAAQYWDEKKVPWSTLVYSKDSGQTWKCGTGVHPETTEAQVIELQNGSIMINARCNLRGARVVGVTKDLGATWATHPTSRTAQLQEPVCQGSLQAVHDIPGLGSAIFFSNPNSTSSRCQMTLKASRDDAASWPESLHLPYDVRECWGYSCLAPVDAQHVGVLYEGCGELLFLKIPYKEIFSTSQP